LLNGYCITIDTNNACGFAWRWAEATCELWKVVGGMKAVNRFDLIAAPDEVIPLWDEISEWAP
jgi:hypothetical protein